MSLLSSEILAGYWRETEVTTNLIIVLNLVGALVLGLIVGYERSYRGRAAGMRTYGLVCMASAALTVMSGYPAHWFGGQTDGLSLIDPTRTVQGIVTGIGFLGAGIIMKDGFNISGLTTAASIWAASAIGILVGIGFYAAAILLTALSAGFMLWGGHLEALLPARHALALTLRFRQGFMPSSNLVDHMAHRLGYDIAKGSLAIFVENDQAEWRFVAISRGRKMATPLFEIARALSDFEGLESYQMAHARN